MADFIGRSHPVLVHLPIGILLLALVFEVLSRRERWQGLQPAMPFILLSGTVAAAVSCLTGWLQAQNGAYEQSLVTRHQYLGIGVAILSLSMYWLKSKRHLPGYMVASFALLPGILLTGHLGISLTHGEGYLTGSAISDEPETTAHFSEIPNVQVSPPSAEAIAILQQEGVIVLPVGQDLPFLSLNFVNAEQSTPAMCRALESLKEQVIWLKLSGIALNDSTLSLIANFENLTKLSLDHTGITDPALRHLEKMEHLVYLNLVGTSVTAQGVASLGRLPNLQKLFLYQTGVTASDTAFLQTKLPRVQIDMGDYQVPVLPTDTTMLREQK